MDLPSKHWLTAIIFEHSCKHNLDSVLKNIIGDKELAPRLLQYCGGKLLDKPKIKPVFFLIYLLKKLYAALDSFPQLDKDKKNSWDSNALPIIMDLLESAYQQHNFISLKKYFTLVSELKLLDMMYLLEIKAESSRIIQKLNQHFPRWRPSHRTILEKEFKIENSSVLDKVEESHLQCRRQTLKLAVDQEYRSKYMAEQFSNDLKKLLTESKKYILEVIAALESHAGASVIEMIISGQDNASWSFDPGCELLLEYLQPNVSPDNLLKFLQELEPPVFSQSTSGLSACLLPFDSMSETSEACPDLESEESDLEPENSMPDDLKLVVDEDNLLDSYVFVPPSNATNISKASSSSMSADKDE